MWYKQISHCLKDTAEKKKITWREKQLDCTIKHRLVLVLVCVLVSISDSRKEK